MIVSWLSVDTPAACKNKKFDPQKSPQEIVAILQRCRNKYERLTGNTSGQSMFLPFAVTQKYPPQAVWKDYPKKKVKKPC